MRLATLAALLAALLALPAVAMAEGAQPEPGCLGSNFSDPAGDARDRESTLDVTGAFLTTVDGKPRLNLVIDDLDASVPFGYEGKSYRVAYVSEGLDWVVTAWFRDGNVHFEARDDEFYSSDIAGRVWEGPGGILEYELPGVASGGEIMIGGIVTTADVFPEAEFVPDETPFRVSYDRALGRSQQLICPAPAPAAAPAPEPAQASPSPSAAPSPSTTPAPSTSQPARTRLSVRRSSRSARRVAGRLAPASATGSVETVRLGARRRVVGRAAVRAGSFRLTLPRGRGRYLLRFRPADARSFTAAESRILRVGRR